MTRTDLEQLKAEATRVAISLSHTPHRWQQYTAQASVTRCVDCGEFVVALLGEGLSGALIEAPCEPVEDGEEFTLGAIEVASHLHARTRGGIKDVTTTRAAVKALAQRAPRKSTRASKRVPAPREAARSHEAQLGQPVIGPGGKKLSLWKTNYSDNKGAACIVKGCDEPMRDAKGRRTGAKGACRLHYVAWTRARDAALAADKTPPPPPNEA